jgi:hypothetical protein
MIFNFKRFRLESIRFEQACLEAGIKMPKTIKDYDII